MFDFTRSTVLHVAIVPLLSHLCACGSESNDSSRADLRLPAEWAGAASIELASMPSSDGHNASAPEPEPGVLTFALRDSVGHAVYIDSFPCGATYDAFTQHDSDGHRVLLVQTGRDRASCTRQDRALRFALRGNDILDRTSYGADQPLPVLRLYRQDSADAEPRLVGSAVGGAPDVDCTALAHCSTDLRCDGELACVGTPRCASACFDTESACMLVCGTPDCSLSNTSPSQVTCPVP